MCVFFPPQDGIAHLTGKIDNMALGDAGAGAKADGKQKCLKFGNDWGGGVVSGVSLECLLARGGSVFTVTTQ